MPDAHFARGVVPYDSWVTSTWARRSRRRHGTTVSGTPPAPTPAEVAEAADQLLTRARAAGLGWEDLQGLLGRHRALLDGPPAPAGPGTGSPPRR